MDPRELTGKVAIVTGASSGLGQATAILFARRGALVVLSGRDKDRLDTAVGECQEASGGHVDRFISVAGDVNDAQVRQTIVDKTVQTFGKLDILIANAGMALPKSGIDQATEATFDTVMNTNAKSVFFLIQAALPHLEKSKGNIVSMSSVASVTGMSDSPIYPMSKAALDHMMRCLAKDFAPKGIRINTVNPAFVPTRIVRHYFNDGPSLEIAKKVAEQEAPHYPLRGECVTEEAVAELVAFLASDAASCITGQIHIIDSGRSFVKD